MAFCTWTILRSWTWTQPSQTFWNVKDGSNTLLCWGYLKPFQDWDGRLRHWRRFQHDLKFWSIGLAHLFLQLAISCTFYQISTEKIAWHHSQTNERLKINSKRFRDQSENQDWSTWKQDHLKTQKTHLKSCCVPKQKIFQKSNEIQEES